MSKPKRPDYTIRYTSPEDRRIHLEANARNRGLPPGSLFEYNEDREAMLRGLKKRKGKTLKQLMAEHMEEK